MHFKLPSNTTNSCEIKKWNVNYNDNCENCNHETTNLWNLYSMFNKGILPQDKLILLVPASSSLYPDIYKIVNQNISLILVSLFLPPYNISKVTVSNSSRKRNENSGFFRLSIIRRWVSLWKRPCFKSATEVDNNYLPLVIYLRIILSAPISCWVLNSPYWTVKKNTNIT